MEKKIERKLACLYFGLATNNNECYSYLTLKISWGQSFEEAGFLMQGWSQITLRLMLLKSIAVMIYSNK